MSTDRFTTKRLSHIDRRLSPPDSFQFNAPITSNQDRGGDRGSNRGDRGGNDGSKGGVAGSAKNESGSNTSPDPGSSRQAYSDWLSDLIRE